MSILAPFANVEAAESYYHREGFNVGCAICAHCDGQLFWALDGAVPTSIICPVCEKPTSEIYQRIFPKPEMLRVTDPRSANQQNKTMNTPVPETAPATKAPTEDYSKFVGKFFKLRPESEHVKINRSKAAERFKISAFLPQFDFGAVYGGVKDAFEFHRLNPPGRIHASCKKFLEDHVELTAEEAAELQPK